MRSHQSFRSPIVNTIYFGNVASIDFGYASHFTHQTTGLALAPYRAYDAKIGRWLSRDPIGEAGGLNLYAYVGGNPVNAVDPLGLEAVLVPPGVGIGGGSVIGGGSAIGLGPIFAGIGAIIYSGPVGEGSDIVPPYESRNKDVRKIIKGLQDQVDAHKEN